MNNTQVIYKEMGMNTPSNTDIEYSVCFGNKYYLSTKLNLKGKGIKQLSDGTDHVRGYNTYTATELALEKLKKSYKLAYMASL